MVEGRRESRTTGRLLTGLAAGAAIALGLSVGMTSAAWVDSTGFSAAATGSTFDIQSRFAADAEWEDVGLPGDPDTFDEGFEVTIPPIKDVLPGHSYVGDVFLCNAGELDGRIYHATPQPPFNNLPPEENFKGQLYGASGGNFDNAPDYETSGIILATPAGEYQYASLTVSYTTTICATGVTEPAWQPPGPTTYTQRSPVQFLLNFGQPCVAGTVDGHQPYFVGFTVEFNWKAVLDAELAAARITPAQYNQWITYTHWAGGPQGYFGSQGATGTDFLTTLQGYQVESRTVATYAPVTIASCSY